ncbi:MAG TPA: 1,4-alpha-glucan branching protein GlgB [Saprospiraceae bacterium]|nr:1,4-alpha-glucan branching protein GlgB [Saprospiraceae bacterium]
MSTVLHHSLFSEFDIYLFKSGKHYRIQDKLGSHLIEVDGVKGVYFAVWAPNAKFVSVIGNFNYWSKGEHPLAARWDGSGIWEGFIPNIGNGELYKYHIESPSGEHLEKGDPYARFWEVPPSTASIVWEAPYEWKDKKWLEKRKAKAGQPQPYSVYEVHLGSWRKKEGGAESLSYRELADDLVTYVKEMGFTHIEFLPVMEHPFFPSWGYQLTGYFAPTSRFGTPEDFKYLVDACHQAGIGVLVDWVPSHFPTDAHGLSMFDGTHLYEHEDPKQGFHPDWKSSIFNYGRNEVRNFLISNALFWLEEYHIDGLRVDAVASMLYLDYSREEGEWVPNEHGGNENLEAIAFLREFNENIYKEVPDAITIAEESTAWSGVSRPTFTGGLGFGQKWMMGWMHDTLNYFKRDPIYRKYHHGEITFSLIYAFTENFMLPLSHDEVVHGKGALIGRMPGDDWQRFANLRLLFGYMFTHPGTKLLFMGGEFGQTSEWNIEKGLEWWLLDHAPHQGVRDWVKALNDYYRSSKPLYEKQFENEGFEWIDHGDAENSFLSFLRKGEDSEIVIACNFTPTPKWPYRLGVPSGGVWKEVMNSDAKIYGGTGDHMNSKHKATEGEWAGRSHYIEIAMAPLAIMVFEKVK